MKAAHVAVALLSGFGSESQNLSNQKKVDVDDAARRSKLERRRIGSNRGSHGVGTGTGDSSFRPEKRVAAAMEKAKRDVLHNAAKRQGLDASSIDEVALTGAVTKELISEYFRIIKEERERAKKLKKGGGDAARILAEEYTDVEEHKAIDGESSVVKPGEASLIAPFSCLRPSIDGVESMLRHSVSGAACCLFAQQSIALNSLESCSRLATIYRGGFRYSHMMIVVLTNSCRLLYELSYRVSSTPRSRLPSSVHSRPPPSLFSPASLVPLTFQATAHLVSMRIAVKFADGLSKSYGEPQQPGLTLRLNVLPHGPERLRLLTEALVSHTSSSTGKEAGPKTDFLGRPIFRPNYLCNVAFIFSMFQYTISKLLNHKGAPFYESILENRQLCQTAGIMLLFVVACVCETFPSWNAVLGLKRLPSPKAKLILLSILGMNVGVGVLGSLLGTRISRAEEHGYHSDVNSNTEISPDGEVAADLEERLLEEELSANKKRMLIFVLGAGYMVFGVVLEYFMHLVTS